MDNSIHVWLIPGMGADHRIFDRIHIEGVKTHSFDWPVQLEFKTLIELAEYYAKQIPPGRNVLIGLSMGGMVVTELHKLVKPELTILVCAPSDLKHMKWNLQLIRKIRIYKLFSGRMMMRLAKTAFRIRGVGKGQTGRLLYDMADAVGPQFLEKSAHAIMNWQPVNDEGKFIHIIGDRDELFNYRRMKNPVVIRGANHAGVLLKGDSFSKAINEELQKRFMSKGVKEA